MKDSRFHDRSGDLDDILDDVVADYVDRVNAGEMIHPEEILSEHPTLCGEILDQLEAFVSVGHSRVLEEPLGTLGDYTLRRQIGRGGMGVVYEAWQNSVERTVALKVLPAGVAADNKAFVRFMREAKTAAQLRHANVVGVHGMGVEENTPYYAMEYVEGETLAQVLGRLKDARDDTETPFGRKNHRDFFNRLAAAFAEVADGLQHAHSKGVVHRDIKPSNLILDAEGDRGGSLKPERSGGRSPKLRILDFGLARLEGQESLTRSDEFIGTPLYMSPEQARRHEIPIDHRTDIYSLGATMYESLVGTPPFVGKDHHDTIHRITRDEPIRLRRRNRRIPKDLETIIVKCLRKNPAARYGTAESLAGELRRFARGDPISTHAQPAWKGVGRRLWSYRHRATVPFMVLTIALGAGLLSMLPVRDGEADLSDRIEDRLKALRPLNVTMMRDIQRYRRLLLPDLKSYGAVDQALRQEVLIAEGDSWRFLEFSSAVPTNWSETGFDDSSWLVETSPFRSESALHRTEGQTVDAERGEGHRYYRRFHLRRRFSLSDASSYRRLYLWVIVRDGIVAYLNGEEIGRRGSLTPGGIGTIPWSSFVRPLPRDLLRNGENVLALDCALRSVHEQFSLVPVLVGDVVYDANRDEMVFQEFLHGASGDNAQEVRRYLEGRIAQRSGRYEVAAQLFDLVAGESESPEPALRLGECLRAAGLPGNAEERLRGLMARPIPQADLVAALWAEICLGDLGYSAAKLRKTLDGLDGVPSVRYVREVLDRILSGHPIRINCGAEYDYGKAQEAPWVSDRFYRGGFDFFKPVGESDPLCDWLRWWAWDPLEAPVYAIPLPGGRYEVTLAFLETNRSRARVFGVSVADGPFVRVEPEYGVLEEKVWTVDVQDGRLEVNFGHDESGSARSDTHPYVSAIEIRPVD